MSTWLCTLHYVEAAGPARVVGWRSAGPDRQGGREHGDGRGKGGEKEEDWGNRIGKLSVNWQGFVFIVPFIMVILTLARMLLFMQEKKRNI